VTAKVLADTYMQLGLMGLSTDAVVTPKLDINSFDYFQQRLKTFTICDQCMELVAIVQKAQASEMTIKNFCPVRMSTELPSSLEAGEYFLIRLYMWSSHTIRYRLLGQDFSVRPGKPTI